MTTNSSYDRTCGGGSLSQLISGKAKSGIVSPKSEMINLQALGQHSSIRGGRFSFSSFQVDWYNTWIHIPYHNACEAHKNCGM